jgi:hypothetical protein
MIGNMWEGITARPGLLHDYKDSKVVEYSYQEVKYPIIESPNSEIYRSANGLSREGLSGSCTIGLRYERNFFGDGPRSRVGYLTVDFLEMCRVIWI